MIDLVICKFHNDLIKTAAANAVTMSKIGFFLHSRASNTKIMKSNLAKF